MSNKSETLKSPETGKQVRVYLTPEQDMNIEMHRLQIQRSGDPKPNKRTVVEKILVAGMKVLGIQN